MDIVITKFKSSGQNAVQEAVDECAAQGGGRVIVPAGTYKTGSIHLKSNVELHLEDGAVLSFSDNPNDYLPVVFTRWEGMECYNYSPLIYANGCENIAVTGRGTLIGNGASWWGWKERQQKAAEELCYAESNGIPPEKRIYGTEKAALRPSFIQPIHCKNVLLEGFTIKDGPQWTIHPVYCENVSVRNVNVLTEGHNTDGLNPDSCRKVLIENCRFDTGDDCIAINSGMNEDGQRVGKPCEDIEIRNCRMNGGHGGIVIGSAMSGGVKNVYAHDCDINGTMQGLRIKSMRGRGGYIDGVRFENIKISNASDAAVEINMFYKFSTVMPKSSAAPELKNVEIKNITGKDNETGILINGLPEKKMQNVVLENIEITAKKAFVTSEAQEVIIKNINIKEP